MFTIFACVFGVFECLNEFSYIRDGLLMHAVIVFDMCLALFGVLCVSGLKECASGCTGGEYGDEVSELFGELCVAGMVGVAFGVGVFATVTCGGDCSCG